MKYKMLVLDLDDTLTNDRKEITPKTKEALMKAQEAGIRIVLASGRPTFGIAPLADELEIYKYGGVVMAFNGGKIMDWTTQNVMFEQVLNEEYVPFLFHKATENGMSILTYQGKAIAATKEDDEYVQHEAFINKMPIVQYDDFLHQVTYPINKCLIVGNPLPLHQLELEISREMDGKMSVYRSADFFLECVPLGVDKAKSLQRLIDELSIRKEETIACGDGYNDLSMIKYAGLGVAMENANQTVKEAADFITLSNENDGIAYVIEHFILEG